MSAEANDPTPTVFNDEPELSEIDKLRAEVTRLTEEVGRREALLDEFRQKHPIAGAICNQLADALGVDWRDHSLVELVMEAARLLAQRTPRPVPEGECPRHYVAKEHLFDSPDDRYYETHIGIVVDGKPQYIANSIEEAHAVLASHRALVAADCYPELVARIAALEAECAKLRDDALIKDAALKLLGGEHKALVDAHNARVRAAQSAPSGLDASTWTVVREAVENATRDLRVERDRLRRDLTNAEGDAAILAHAYESDNRPPPDVVTRALSYRAGRPPQSPPTEEEPTQP